MAGLDFLSIAAGLALEPAHLVGTGGAIGAIARHIVYTRLSTDSFPLATLLVNVLGSTLFALLVFGGAGESTVQLLGIGACGAFTTFSTFSVETVQRWERGQRGVAVLNAIANLLGALAGIGVAWLLLAM
ncbi:fluoride efflux transporter FluC [Natronosalvus vescus]|uniref:fluoride efflux transporter FluC n=1 Tax=Natronosalvus vescus TaxID=2953881 RepID=UPI002091AD85|nr:CrcB family protein [Natronosalvus vescus]